jgi:hypothetical protein
MEPSRSVGKPSLFNNGRACANPMSSSCSSLAEDFIELNASPFDKGCLGWSGRLNLLTLPSVKLVETSRGSLASDSDRGWDLRPIVGAVEPLYPLPVDFAHTLRPMSLFALCITLKAMLWEGIMEEAGLVGQSGIHKEFLLVTLGQVIHVVFYYEGVLSLTLALIVTL